MTVLFGATQGVAALKSEALAIHQAKRPKYYLRAGTEYLHFSGLMLTTNHSQAWIGTIDQARACRRKFPAAAGCKIRSITPIPAHVEDEA